MCYYFFDIKFFMRYRSAVESRDDMAREEAVHLPPEVLGKIKLRMAEFHLTQERLAKLINCHQPRLNEMLTGRKAFRLGVLKSVLACLVLDELYSYLPEPPSQQDTAEHARLMALEIIGQWLAEAAEHDRQEFLLIVAVSMEGKPPYGLNKYSRFLRAMAHLAPQLMQSHHSSLSPT
jgi:ParB-like chromosome segregation protein Spo0J